MKKFLLIGALIAAPAGSASAATFVQTLLLSGDSGSATGTAFDATLGTLTSVRMTMRSRRDYSFAARALPLETGRVATDLDYTVIFDLNNHIVGDVGLASGSARANISPGASISGNGSASYFRSFSINDIASIGLFASGLAPVLTYRFDPGREDVRGNSGLAFFSGSFGSLNSNVEITYDYTARVIDAGAVPEPTSWAMMIAGFGMVGGAMRRRARPDTNNGDTMLIG